MTRLNPKQSWQNDLWNVSLLPSGEDLPSPPRRPEPPAADALGRPPLLSVCETVAPERWLQAA
jgi:hypothetical protein